MKVKNSLKIGYLIVLTLVSCSCARFESNISTADQDTPVIAQETPVPTPVEVPPEVPELPNPDICTQGQLSQIETEIKHTLATRETDADFSLKVESEDGRVFEFNRGLASMLTSYESASTSKWISATIILSYMESAENLASAQPLRLDSKPQDFIKNNWPIAANDPLYNMTLRDLLSFTSGLTEEATCLNRGDSDFEACVITMASANANNGRVPGTIYFYSGVHLQVAGLMAIKARNIAKSVSNSSWQSVFEDFKLKTGLFKNSSYDLPSASNPRLAGGMHWIGNDYVEFLRLFSKEKILSPELTRLQLSDQVGNAVILASPANKGTGEDWHYGFGLWAECHSEVFNCTGSIEIFSSAGAYGAYPFINVKHKFYGLLARQSGLGTGFLGYLAYAAVAGQIEKWATKNCAQ